MCVNAKSCGDITFVSAAFPNNRDVNDLIFGLNISNQRYKNFHINYYGNNSTSKDFSLYNAKIIKLLQFIEYKVPTKIICFLDSADVILNKDFDDDFINIFRSFNCKLLFGAETNCFPKSFDFVNCDIDSEFKYLNSGMFVGYKDYIIYILKQCMGYKEHLTQKISNIGFLSNDQTLFWLAYLSDILSLKNDIKLDFHFDLFLNLIGKDISNFDISHGYLSFRDKRPYIVHANGASKHNIYTNLIRTIFNKEVNDDVWNKTIQ